jgi:hypothetical protein
VEAKIFDLRDSGTEMGAFAIRLDADSDLERDVLARRGFSSGTGFIIGTLGPAPIDATYDRFHWDHGEHVRRNGTMFRAHELIVDRWEELTSGDLIDLDDPRT